MHNQLDEKQKAVIPIACFTAIGEMEKLNSALHWGLNTGITVNELKEILVHLYAYCGFPRSLNAISVMMTVVENRHHKGIIDKTGRESSPTPPGWNSLIAGTKNQTQLVGKPVSGALFDFAPTIDQFLKSHLFGDIFQRDVLDWCTRELVTLSALASMPGLSSQLRSHYAISLNSGLTIEQLYHFVDILETECGNTVTRARECLTQCLDTEKNH
ncbi:carboxymuconolactone decarboxylase family protein [Pectobacterium aquaticum]|uniref:carboxymuconolactone decarboxylase family protein n=1 Tax=Pectobacterium aquaticum TaxID=2204145 RepID=UPI001F11490D|nr:carboxymuconolactone decarboxylase family protein [Pectobacterium aquaticum]MCH5050784.1 carboxymuconolactone decarboxylase family protein [Pectobacterium aquaticum]